MKPEFLVDVNAGSLARRLRMLGYDTRFIHGADDNELIRIALREGRILLTRDTGIIARRVVTIGKINAILIESDNVKEQLRQIVKQLNLGMDSHPFSMCMECNSSLVSKEKEEIRHLVPPYVYMTQNLFMQCPGCERIYWKGTHWQKMMEEVAGLFD